MTKELIREIPIAWSHIREARRLVQEALAEHDRDLRDAAGMTVSELIENAMKYGESVPALTGARFKVSIDEREVLIEVQNGSSGETVENLLRVLDEIGAAEGQEAREGLYVARLQEIMEAPASGGRLGLYRIGFEGGFDLTGHYADGVVTVQARRALA